MPKVPTLRTYYRSILRITTKQLTSIQKRIGELQRDEQKIVAAKVEAEEYLRDADATDTEEQYDLPMRPDPLA
jgi:hypothetical protein